MLDKQASSQALSGGKAHGEPLSVVQTADGAFGLIRLLLRLRLLCRYKVKYYSALFSE